MIHIQYTHIETCKHHLYSVPLCRVQLHMYGEEETPGIQHALARISECFHKLEEHRRTLVGLHLMTGARFILCSTHSLHTHTLKYIDYKHH